MRERVLQLLQEECPLVDFSSSVALADDGVLDSLSITNIIAALTMEFDIVIPYEDIVEKNFNSVDAIAAMVERLKT